MAAPSSVSTFPYTITESGEANGALIALGQSYPNGPDATLKVAVSGTYGTATLVVRGRLGGMTTFFPLAGVDIPAGTAVGTGGTIALTDNTSYLFRFPVAGFDQVEVYASALGSGSILVEKASGPAESVSPPIVNATTTTTSLAAATTVTSTSASALAVGANGATNPVLKVNANTASVATGLTIVGAAAAGGVALTVISSGTDESLVVNAKGSGGISLNATATGTVTIGSSLTMADAKDIILNTTTGTKIGTATTQKLGFYNATPVVQRSAYTQTYSTADKTHSNLTSATLTDNTAGTANTTLQALADGTTYATDVAAIRNNFADLAASNNAIIVDLTDLKQLVNSVIDDLQALGLVA